MRQKGRKEETAGKTEGAAEGRGGGRKGRKEETAGKTGGRRKEGRRVKRRGAGAPVRGRADKYRRRAGKGRPLAAAQGRASGACGVYI